MSKRVERLKDYDECEAFLYLQGADPFLESRSGHTALTWAAACGVDLVVEELLRHRGQGDNAVDALTRATAHEGKTVLHCAALSGNPEVAMRLLDHLRNDLLLCRR